MLAPNSDIVQLLQSLMGEERTIVRKLSTYAMCLLMTVPQLPQEIKGPLCLFMNNFDQISFGPSKVIIN
jgi:hypothetical protein